MSPTVNRNLTFRSNDLGRRLTLLLVFDDRMDGIYKTYFPVVWKVLNFRERGPYSFTVSYSNDLAFTKAQVTYENLIIPSTYTKLKPGQQTTLTKGDDDLFSFSNPVAGTPGLLKAFNKTGLIEEFAVGFLNQLDPFMPFPALYFRRAEDGSYVAAEWKPILRVYIAAEYQESSVLVEPIDTDAIWSKDLHTLPQDTFWDLTWDAATGRYKLTQGVV